MKTFPLLLVWLLTFLLSAPSFAALECVDYGAQKRGISEVDIIVRNQCSHKIFWKMCVEKKRFHSGVSYRAFPQGETAPGEDSRVNLWLAKYKDAMDFEQLERFNYTINYGTTDQFAPECKYAICEELDKSFEKEEVALRKTAVDKQMSIDYRTCQEEPDPSSCRARLEALGKRYEREDAQLYAQSSKNHSQQQSAAGCWEDARMLD